jgi:hypothetical protein
MEGDENSPFGPFRSHKELGAAIATAESFTGRSISGVLGMGDNGVAYSDSIGGVLKFTTSAIEAITANFLRSIQQQNPSDMRGIASILTDAFIAYGDGNSDDSIYCYALELLEPVTKEQAKQLHEYVDKSSSDEKPSNAFWHAYRAVHSEWQAKDKAAKTRYHKRYLANLARTDDYEGFSEASSSVMYLATTSDFGGPFLVGDFKPINCGTPMATDGPWKGQFAGWYKAFDLYVYNIPDKQRFMPKAVK